MAVPMIGLSIILAILPLACLAGETRSLARSIDPLEVSGSEVSNMTGVEVSHLRVISSRNGKLTPIPFQIDQKNSKDERCKNSGGAQEASGCFSLFDCAKGLVVAGLRPTAMIAPWIPAYAEMAGTWLNLVSKLHASATFFVFNDIFHSI